MTLFCSLRSHSHHTASQTSDALSCCLTGLRHTRTKSYSSYAAPGTADSTSPAPDMVCTPSARRLIGSIAKQKEANKEFFTELLSSAATKRDAKAYITRLKEPSKPPPAPTPDNVARSQVNLGNLFGRARSLDSSPVFSQHAIQERESHDPELHIALVEFTGVANLPDHLIHGVAQTLSQLARLGTVPCVILASAKTDSANVRHDLVQDAERLRKAIDTVSERGAWIIDDLFSVSELGVVKLSSPKLLCHALRRERIPIVLPQACLERDQKITPVPSQDAFLALTRAFSTPGKALSPLIPTKSPKAFTHNQQQQRIFLDRVIIIDESGGIPSPRASDGRHVFVNLEQEYKHLERQLHDSGDDTAPQHLSNLDLLKKALDILPPSSSGLMTTPLEASNPSESGLSSAPTVGTRRRRNALIHNLLTDRPAFSSSLPKARLAKASEASSPDGASTFVKRGMPLKLIPDPFEQPWSPNSNLAKLTDPSIDLDRLVHLIDDSFSRKLNIDHYLDRVNHSLAGVIIAGDYEGGAILTWEAPPGVDPSDKARLVPYLDKFAVLKKSQGAGGVADIVFNAMVRSCFPSGVCWRSRKNNPVNKWYFERSTGTWKIPDMNWTMFWTTPGAVMTEQTFRDYEGVCRGVIPSWADLKQAAD